PAPARARGVVRGQPRRPPSCLLEGRAYGRRGGGAARVLGVSPVTEDEEVKRDDCTLSPADLKNVRRHAERLLRVGGANGRLPTPVPDLVAAARLEVARDVSLDQGFLRRLYRKITVPIRRAIDKVLGLLD